MPAPTHTSPAENSAKSSRRKKIKAILASGTVLGIGAVVTMATWNDSQFAEGKFTAGEYGVVSSADGEFYESHGAGNTATLEFEASNAAPGDEFAAGFWLKPSQESSYAGEVTGIAVETLEGGQPQNFEKVEIRHLSSDANCADATSDEAIIASGTSLDALIYPEDQRIQLPNDSPTQLCFQVTAAETLVSGQTTSATWEVETASVSEN